MNGSKNGKYGKYDGPYVHLSSLKLNDDMYQQVVCEAAYLSIIRGRPISIAQVLREIVGDYFEQVQKARAEQPIEQLDHIQYAASERTDLNG